MVTPQIDAAATTVQNNARLGPMAAPTLVPQVITAPVRRVVLLEDRAVIERRATLQLAPGPWRLVVPSVSAVLSDRSLSVRAPDGIRVDDAMVRREWRIGAQEQPEDAGATTKERQELQQAVALQAAEGQVSRDSRDLISQATATFFEGLNRQLPFAEDFRPEWREHVERLFAKLRAADDALHDNERSMREVRSKLDAVDLRLAALGRLDHFLATELRVDLTAIALPQSAAWTLTIQYVVPCAMWRPTHRAHLCTDRLRFECEAAVWQATGEDWTDVELLFSTARSTQRSEPPVLSDDVITTRAKVEKTIVVAEREQTISTTGEGMDSSNIELPGVDDGGETRLLKAPTPATVVADGRVRRIAISGFETQSTVERVARPERSTLVHRQARQSNTGSHVILAGPVELLRDGALIGRGEVGFVAPQEAFVLGFGGDDALRIKRTTSEVRETAKLTGRQTITRTVELFISNIGPQIASFKLEERIPVSEIEQITVELDAKVTTPAATADENGMVRWQISVPAFGTEKVKLSYKLCASSDVQGL